MRDRVKFKKKYYCFVHVWDARYLSMDYYKNWCLIKLIQEVSQKFTWVLSVSIFIDNILNVFVVVVCLLH